MHLRKVHLESVEPRETVSGRLGGDRQGQVQASEEPWYLLTLGWALESYKKEHNAVGALSMLCSYFSVWKVEDIHGSIAVTVF